MNKSKKILSKAIIPIFFFIALIAEIYIFNFRYWTSLGNEPVSISLPQNGTDDPYGDFTINLSSQKISVKNIGFCFEPVEESIPVSSTRTFYFTPRRPARLTVCYNKTNGESITVTKEYAYNPEQTCILTLDTVNTESIDFSYDDAYFTNLYVNAKYDFSFSLYRFCIVFMLLCFVRLFRSRSALWKMRFFDDNMNVEKKLLIIHPLLCALLLIVTSSLFFSNPFFKDIPDVLYFYPELARSFANGHTYDAELPSQELLALPDPYDAQARIDGDVPYKLDRLLYNNRYYTYYGPLPCVLFYLPYYLITGNDMPHYLIIIALIAFFLCVTSLALTEAYKRYKPDGSVAGFYTGFLTLFIVTPLTTMASCDTFPCYIPIFSALILFISGVYFYLKAANQTDNGHSGNVFFALGSASIALISACRPNMLLFALALVPLLIPYAGIKKENLSRWISFITPVIVVAIPVLLYNYVRFGNPFDYGFSYHLTIDGPQKHPSLSSILAAIWHYFLRPIYFTDRFPYVSFVQTEWSNPEGTLVQAVSGGLLLLSPVLIMSMAFFIPSEKEKRSGEAVLTAAILTVLAVISCVISSISGGFTTRYRMDFSTMLGFAAVLMIWKHTNRPEKDGWLRNVLCCLLLISSFSSFTQLFGTDLIDHSTLTDSKCRYEQTYDFLR